MKYGDIDFDVLAHTYDLWWQERLGRPVIPLTISGAAPRRAAPSAPTLNFMTAYDETYSPESLLEREDYELSLREYYGEAFPMINMHSFGPGVLAAFLGAVPHAAESTVWFDDPRRLPLRELHFEFDPENSTFRRVSSFYEVFSRRYADRAVISMTDLGGALDVLSTFRGAENLLCDLYDEPEEVERCVKEIAEAWFAAFDALNKLIAPTARGYSHWDHIYDAEPNYILQSDFSYMIGPEMFDRFTLPELAGSSSRLPHTFYHLDGVGQLAHLDKLLACEGIRGIQWVFGAGTPELTDWSEVYRRIGASGKKLHNLQARLANLEWAVSLMKRADQLILGMQRFDISEKAEALARLGAITG